MHKLFFVAHPQRSSLDEGQYDRATYYLIETLKFKFKLKFKLKLKLKLKLRLRLKL
jgi:hypothetical protein